MSEPVLVINDEDLSRQVHTITIDGDRVEASLVMFPKAPARAVVEIQASADLPTHPPVVGKYLIRDLVPVRDNTGILCRLRLDRWPGHP